MRNRKFHKAARMRNWTANSKWRGGVSTHPRPKVKKFTVESRILGDFDQFWRDKKIGQRIFENKLGGKIGRKILILCSPSRMSGTHFFALHNSSKSMFSSTMEIALLILGRSSPRILADNSLIFPICTATTISNAMLAKTIKVVIVYIFSANLDTNILAHTYFFY